MVGLAADVRTQPGCCPLQVLARTGPQHRVQASETQAERDAHHPASSNPQEKAWEPSGAAGSLSGQLSSGRSGKIM